MTPASQRDRVLAALEAGEEITPVDALRRFGCFRLGARVHELREAGHRIATLSHPLPDGRVVARYRLEDSANV